MMSGDDHLSSYDIGLWQLVQHVLQTWGTFVIFTNQHIHVPNQTRGWINFFVPIDSPHRDEIVVFLETELESYKRDGVELPDVTIPGTDIHVTVLPFSGIDPYMTAAQSKKIVEEFMTTFLAKHKRQKTEDQQATEDQSKAV